MPGLTIERPKMTRTMYQALKKHIMKERERKKQGMFFRSSQKVGVICGH